MHDKRWIATDKQQESYYIINCVFVLSPTLYSVTINSFNSYILNCFTFSLSLQVQTFSSKHTCTTKAFWVIHVTTGRLDKGLNKTFNPSKMNHLRHFIFRDRVLCAEVSKWESHAVCGLRIILADQGARLLFFHRARGHPILCALTII